MSTPAPPAPSRRLAWLTSAMAALVIAFYFWTARSPNVPYQFRGPQEDYYNLLTHGFLAGHLYLPVAPDPRLLSPDPAVRAHAPYLLDASLYHGRYYLYFGVTPVVVAFLPWRLLSGQDLPVNFAAALFATAGFLISVALLWRWRRQQAFSPGTGLWIILILALGFCTVVPAALRRANFYEVAVCAAYAFTLLCFLGLYEAVTASRRRAWWLAVAGLAYGLAVGCRPNLVFGGLLLPAAVGYLWWPERRDAGAAQRLGRLALAALLPAAACLAALLAYNYARFGSLFDFGRRYQIAVGADRPPFALAYLWHNLRLYYFTLPEISRYFPFFLPGAEGSQPPGYFGREFVHGQCWVVPLALLALAGGGAALRRRPAARVVRPAGLALLGWFIVNGLVVGLGGMRANRYQVDFQPALILAVALGLLLLAADGRRRARLGAAGGAALLLFGSFYNVMVSLQTDESFRANNPQAYARLARWFDYPAWWYQRLTREAVGPLQLQVVFPAAPPGRLEPLVATGTPWFSDILYVHYEEPGTIRFVLEHAGHGGPSSGPVAVTPGRPYRLEIALGSLYPPAESPFFSRLPHAQMRLLTRTARVTLDGAIVFHATAPFYDTSPDQVRVGASRLWPAMTTGRFSGRIFARAVEPLDLARLGRKETGPVALRVELPRDRPGAVEPLVVTGVAGRADVLLVQYADGQHVRFGLDHWGQPMIWSPIVPVDYAVPHAIRVDLGSLLAPGVAAGRERLLAVTLDGREVFATPAAFYAAAPLDPDIGCNSVGASSCGRFFGGNILAVTRLGAEAPPPAGSPVVGPFRLRLRLPPGLAGHTEPLFSAEDRDGRPFAVLVHYTGPDSVRFGLLRDGRRWEGPILAVDYSRPHELLVACYPTGPVPFPPAGPLQDYLEHRWGHELGLYLDGRLALASGPLDLPAASAVWHWAGNATGAATGDASFTGGLELLAATDHAGGFAALAAPGAPLQLTVTLPPDSIGRKEPLLVTGVTGGGDALYVDYCDAHHFRFGFDHWGVGGPLSPLVPIDYRQPHVFTVWMDSLRASSTDESAGSGGGLWVEVDGRRVWTLPASFHPATPATRFIGANPIGISTCGPRFTGEILAVERRGD